ncbi:hypothetical protein AOC05_10295 [Arthrobacter alpinus]|uniref:Uncharacterized protein n=1 Tax=Arthrobacter alpinus TaxID=656366 RepID=A0A0M4RC01_9MICC|nr:MULTISPECIES: type II toxin-antitoxin system Phd/YefM family antitoxin [Arthrobacter]ALE92606.1 hypothetical protein AOC05_10295 [Arthrobacter alpinus]
MQTMSYSQSRSNHAAARDAVQNDGEEVVITRSGKEPLVMASPANARRLRGAIDRLEDRSGVEHELLPCRYHFE